VRPQQRPSGEGPERQRTNRIEERHTQVGYLMTAHFTTRTHRRVGDAICPFELLTSVERTAYRFAGSDRAYVVPSPTHLAS
jgi:hypothetical protein